MHQRFASVLVFISLIFSCMGTPLKCQARELLVVGTVFGHVFECSAADKCGGLGVDVIRAIARQTGDTVRFKLYPWARAQAMVENGQADILLGAYKTQERERHFAFSERPFYQDTMVFYARAGDTTGWDGNYASLKGRRVAAVGAWVYGKDFDQARADQKIPEAVQLENGILMLSRGRIDLLATNLRNTEALLPVLHLSGAIKPLKPVLDIQNGYLAFPRRQDHDALRGNFDRVFRQMVDTGELARLGRLHQVAIP
ncbi:MAG TPA: transporter substrate-binding domain-containing protein [Janthinobacterium sp.]|jgi:polar amino acid transport system substrate-binding protein|nr:transporter substrate-binding domain-containing protein [Janthinobacterium sp.]